MTRSERKEQAKIRCENRIEEYKKRIQKYISSMEVSIDKVLTRLHDYKETDIRNNPSMKEEINICHNVVHGWICEEYADKLEPSNKLTKEQIENWRRVLFGMGVGAYALIMPEEDIQKFRNHMQNAFN